MDGKTQKWAENTKMDGWAHRKRGIEGAIDALVCFVDFGLVDGRMRWGVGSTLLLTPNGIDLGIVILEIEYSREGEINHRKRVARDIARGYLTLLERGGNDYDQRRLSLHIQAERWRMTAIRLGWMEDFSVFPMGDQLVPDELLTALRTFA